MRDFFLVLLAAGIVTIVLEGSPEIGGIFLLLLLLATLARQKTKIPTLTAGSP